MRIGYGLDIHKFGGNKPLIIGGVKIPYKKGIIAHSNGDVILHALTDAILGAGGFGDIGKFFPDTNKNLKNINSQHFLKIGYSKITQIGLKIGNIDITVIAQEPKISPYVSKIKKNISNYLNCNIKLINIKATTTEKLGFIGREEGISCTAIVLLKKNKKQLSKKKN